jgi:hypothetical protein
MKEHAEKVKAGIQGSASSPALSMLGRVPPALKKDSGQVRIPSPLAAESRAKTRVPLSSAGGLEVESSEASEEMGSRGMKIGLLERSVGGL